VVAWLGEREQGGRVTTVAVEVEIDAPPEAVWGVVSEPRNLHHWERHVAKVRDLPTGPLHEGASYTAVMRFLRVSANVRVDILVWEPPRYAEFRLTGPLEAVVRTTVQPLRGKRSVLRHEVDYQFPLGPLGQLAARSLALVGGAHFALKRGALAQKGEIEFERSLTDPS
jgi:ligand-binding SRPBCC domain-containing protein